MVFDSIYLNSFYNPLSRESIGRPNLAELCALIPYLVLTPMLQYGKVTTGYGNGGLSCGCDQD